MITHVVMFKFKEPTAKNLERGKALLDGLPADISEIKTFDVGIDVLRSERSWDLVLVSTFADVEALERYRAHPRHEEVARHLVEASELRASVDFEN